MKCMSKKSERSRNEFRRQRESEEREKLLASMTDDKRAEFLQNEEKQRCERQRVMHDFINNVNTIYKHLGTKYY